MSTRPVGHRAEARPGCYRADLLRNLAVTLRGRVTSGGQRYHVPAESDCTPAHIALATGEMRAALRMLVSGRLRDAAVHELRAAVAEILARPGLGWECVAPGHGEVDPCDGLELDGRGRLEILMRDTGAEGSEESAGLFSVTSDDLDLPVAERVALTSWLGRETRARDLLERGHTPDPAGSPHPDRGHRADGQDDDVIHAASD